MKGRSHENAKRIRRNRKNARQPAEALCRQDLLHGHLGGSAREETQDAFVKAFRSLASFEFHSSFCTWVCRIAYNESLNRLRRQQRHFVDIADIPAEEVDEELSTGREERIALMEEAIDDLPPDERLLLHLYYYEDRHLREIAYIMDAETNALATRLHRIRKKLLQMIKQKENE